MKKRPNQLHWPESGYTPVGPFLVDNWSMPYVVGLAFALGFLLIREIVFWAVPVIDGWIRGAGW
jgi:hypothetical protein